MSQTVWVTIAVQIEDGADVHETINEMDYTIKHKDIIDTEVMEIETPEENWDENFNNC